MIVNDVKNIRVRAIKLNSKKEKILINGDVYVPSCLIGLWNCIVIVKKKIYDETGNSTGYESLVESKHRDEYRAVNGVDLAKAKYARLESEGAKPFDATFTTVVIARKK